MPMPASAVAAPSAVMPSPTAASAAAPIRTALCDLYAVVFRLFGQLPFRKILGTRGAKLCKRIACCRPGLAWHGGGERGSARDTEQPGQK
jgi:hypothetical protein